MNIIEYKALNNVIKEAEENGNKQLTIFLKELKAVKIFLDIHIDYPEKENATEAYYEKQTMLRLLKSLMNKMKEEA